MAKDAGVHELPATNELPGGAPPPGERRERG
jgi:hypothetical protein